MSFAVSFFNAFPPRVVNTFSPRVVGHATISRKESAEKVQCEVILKSMISICSDIEKVFELCLKDQVLGKISMTSFMNSLRVSELRAPGRNDFNGIGTALIQVAIEQSFVLGFNGSINLQASPLGIKGCSTFYFKCGLRSHERSWNFAMQSEITAQKLSSVTRKPMTLDDPLEMTLKDPNLSEWKRRIARNPITMTDTTKLNEFRSLIIAPLYQLHTTNPLTLFQNSRSVRLLEALLEEQDETHRELVEALKPVPKVHEETFNTTLFKVVAVRDFFQHLSKYVNKRSLTSMKTLFSDYEFVVINLIPSKNKVVKMGESSTSDDNFPVQLCNWEEWHKFNYGEKLANHHEEYFLGPELESESDQETGMSLNLQKGISVTLLPKLSEKTFFRTVLKANPILHLLHCQDKRLAKIDREIIQIFQQNFVDPTLIHTIAKIISNYLFGDISSPEKRFSHLLENQREPSCKYCYASLESQ